MSDELLSSFSLKIMWLFSKTSVSQPSVTSSVAIMADVRGTSLDWTKCSWTASDRASGIGIGIGFMARRGREK